MKNKNSNNKDNNKNKRRRKFPIVKLFVIFFAVLSALYYLHYERIITLPKWLVSENFSEYFIPRAEGCAQVHFIDVGQGDCELIISDDGSTVLIDCGEEDYYPDVLSYLDMCGVERLDYIIATHPHSDHIGGMGYIIKDIDVGTVISPKIPDEYLPNTWVYEHFLEETEKKGCNAKYAENETISLGSGSLEITVPGYSGESLNNYSIVAKFTFGDRKFLFCGDLEWEMEQSLRNSGYDPSADVFKLSHHGSSTSNQILWLAAISPDYYVCECGADNPYGHPHREVVSMINDFGGELLRTDLDGSIVFETDGKALNHRTEKESGGSDVLYN